MNIGRRWRPRDPRRETDLRFLLRLGAFREGLGRRRLLSAGLRWDASMNLLMPDACGSWDPARAREVAASVEREVTEKFGLILLAGTKVTKAFGLKLALLETEGPFLVIPHPSGRNHFWNSGSVAATLVSSTFERVRAARQKTREEFLS